MIGEHQSLLLRCLVTTSTKDADVLADLALLDSDEHGAMRRLLNADDRRDYIAAHALLRRLLSEVSPGTQPAAWRFERTPRGKPFIPRTGNARTLSFSLSHTRGLVACVVGRVGRLGLDVERDAAFGVDGLMASVCSNDEMAQLLARAEPVRTAAFLDFWVLKEAYAKACGTGIADGLKTMSFDLRDPGSVSARLPSAAARWDFAMFQPTADSRVALAVEWHAGTPVVLDAALIGRDGSAIALRSVRTGSTGTRQSIIT